MSPLDTSKRGARLTAAFVIAVAIFYLASWWWSTAPLFADVLTAQRVAPFVSLGKLIPQALGAYYAAKSARHYATGSAVRRAWQLMSLWLSFWFVGQLGLGLYVIGGGMKPVVSIVDVLFISGCALVVVALWTFTSAYRTSGFSVGSRLEHLWFVLGGCAVSALVGYQILMPLIAAPAPLLERSMDVVYPVLDLAMLVSVLPLLGITLRFHGGGVWRVWGSILVGLACATGGDVLFAYTSLQNLTDVRPLAHLAFTLGYVLCAYGARLQYELVATE